MTIVDLCKPSPDSLDLSMDRCSRFFPCLSDPGKPFLSFSFELNSVWLLRKSRKVEEKEIGLFISRLSYYDFQWQSEIVLFFLFGNSKVGSFTF